MIEKGVQGGGRTDAWPRMMTLLVERRDLVFTAIRRLGMTPPHGQLLSQLIAGPQRMSDLAGALVCDASYITSLVDHLEHLGLVERRPSTQDRRVKQIALTNKGAKAAQTIQSVVASEPAQFAKLTAAERGQLDRLMRKMVADDEISADPFRPPPR